MNRLSPTTWMLYGLVGSQLTDRDIPIEGYGDTTTVSKFMEVNFGYYNYMVWWCVLIVLAYCVFFRSEPLEAGGAGRGRQRSARACA